VVSDCPSCVVRRPLTFDVYTLETTFVRRLFLELDHTTCNVCLDNI